MGNVDDNERDVVLLGCGLRRAELTALRVEDIQQREERWVIADLVGKGGHTLQFAAFQNGGCSTTGLPTKDHEDLTQFSSSSSELSSIVVFIGPPACCNVPSSLQLDRLNSHI